MMTQGSWNDQNVSGIYDNGVADNAKDINPMRGIRIMDNEELPESCIPYIIVYIFICLCLSCMINI